MQTLTRAETAAFLAEHDRYTILTHVRPDGDTVGSSAALCLGLRSLGKIAHVLENPEVSPRMAFLHEGITKPAEEPGDCILSVDVASPGMLPKVFEHLTGSITLRIDHHSASTSFTELELVDGGSASCAELVWDILTCMGVKLTPAMADAIYVGTSTDTGCFRFANTTEHTFLAAAACTAAGARTYQLNQTFFETNTLGRLKIQSWIVEHMELLKEGTLALIAIPLAVEQALNLTSDDMDNISNFPRTVAGVQAAATLRETADGDCKLSVRAVPGLDATAVAARFGGGGHKGAAGALIRLPMDQATAALREVLLEVF